MMPSVEMIGHESITSIRLIREIRKKHIRFGGNKKLKIYGKLNCKSGKRMKKVNRVFFESETEAIALGFRPCARCMPRAYKKWKKAASR